MTWPITLSQLFLSIFFLRLASLVFQSFDEAIELRICFHQYNSCILIHIILFALDIFSGGVLNSILGAINCNKYSDAPLDLCCSGAHSTVVILSGASDANQSISRTLVNAAKKDIFSLASGVAERRHWMKETIYNATC